MIFVHPFWGAFFGVFSGIIAGVIIYLIVNWINRCILKRNAIKNLKFEIDHDIKEIDTLLEDLGDFRDKIVADTAESYFRYLILTKVITMQMWSMFSDRSIYKYLESEDIGKLLKFMKNFTLEKERSLNDMIKYHKEHYREPEIRPDIINQIDDLKILFRDNKADLESIYEKL